MRKEMKSVAGHARYFTRTNFSGYDGRLGLSVAGGRDLNSDGISDMIIGQMISRAASR